MTRTKATGAPDFAPDDEWTNASPTRPAMSAA
jgi:hypothetical protein